MKLTTAISLLATLALPLSAAAQEAQTLKIGALVTLSGAGAAWGQGMKNAAEIAAAQVNKSGGLDVVGKQYTVEVVGYDAKYQTNDERKSIAEGKCVLVSVDLGARRILKIKHKYINITKKYTTNNN